MGALLITMISWFTPEVFNSLAITLSNWRWRLLLWSALAFVLFHMLHSITASETPNALILVLLFILFSALQSLVLAAFIFFFQVLPSTKTEDEQWSKFYRTIEWCELILFSVLIPLPIILFIYASFLI